MKKNNASNYLSRLENENIKLKNEKKELLKEIRILKIKVNKYENSLAIKFSNRFRFIFKRINPLVKILRKAVDNRRRELNIIAPKHYSFSHLEKRSIKNYKIACILDEFSYDAFKYEMDLHPIKINNYINQIDELKPDFLFVESAWRGSNMDWKVANEYERMLDLTNHCKTLNIPAIFWSKEDPVHFQHFLNTAKLFDYVFTTDENSIPKYQNELKHNRIYTMPFAAQPKIHNPIQTVNRNHRIVFAGSFYQNKYQERGRQLVEMLEASNKYGLDIFDRNYYLEDENYKFPIKFQENIKGTLEYYEIEKAYKGYKISLNVNTISDSPTMFSRRVFELILCNTIVLSNYSQGIENLLPEVVFMGNTKEDYCSLLDKIYKNDELCRDILQKGVRQVLVNHTYEKRTIDMFNAIGLNVEDKISQRVMLLTNDNKFQDIHNQTYKEFELYDISKTDRIIEDLRNFDYISYFNSDNKYGENYLLDLVLATKYVESPVIGQAYDEKSYVFTSKVPATKCLIKTDIINKTILKAIFQDKYVNLDSFVIYC